jgi:hypothetical protein
VTQGPRLYYQTMARLTTQHPLIGMAMLRHRNARAQPMSFRDRPYLIEWYTDFGQYPKGLDGADIVTAPQVGKTELVMQLLLYEAGWLGRLVANAWPTVIARNHFVKTRINPVLLDVPAYRQKLPARDLAALQKGDTSTDTGSMRSKRFGAGSLLFTAAAVNTDWVEFSVDTMVIDEYDHCLGHSELNLAKAPDRMRASSDPRLYRMGNPEIPRRGIERLWADGDQRLYTWRCPHCGERQPIIWVDSVVRQEDSGQWVLRDPVAQRDPTAPIRPCCLRCARPFEREAAGSCWVAQEHLRDRRSYRTSRFDAIDQPLREAWDEWMMAQGATEKLRAWWRGWQGIAWEPASGGITRTDIVDASILAPMDHQGGAKYKGLSITAGIDVGSLFHVRVSMNVRGAGGRVERRGIWVGTVQTPEQVHDILQRYHVRTATIDEQPELRIAQGIRDDARRYGCTVWLCHFAPTPRAGREEFGLKSDPKARVVVADRTQLMDASADGLRLGGQMGRLYARAGLLPPPFVPANANPEDYADTWAKLDSMPDAGAERATLWPSDAPSLHQFVDQMMASRRLYDDKGVVRWDEGGHADHYRLADAYDLLASVMDGRGARFF